MKSLRALEKSPPTGYRFELSLSGEKDLLGKEMFLLKMVPLQEGFEVEHQFSNIHIINEVADNLRKMLWETQIIDYLQKEKTVEVKTLNVRN